jgi:predicted DsbA family dithiol-disulfide isomerase
MLQAESPDAAKPAVRWLPFQLAPDVPEGGVPRKEYMERKFGAGGMARGHARLEAIGREVGIEFGFDKIEVQPNTLNAHRLMHYAERHGRADEAAEALFKAYFVDGGNLADVNALADIGASAGLDRGALEAYLASDADRDAVRAQIMEAQRAGIGGVPFFIFNRKIGVSGAQDAQTLLAAIREALKP